MPEFGKTSRERIETANPLLQLLFNEVVKEFDCSILVGYRTENAQNECYNLGKSQLKFPESKHNTHPSKAMDVAPYPIDWQDTMRFYYFAGYVKGIASKLGLNIVWGGDWDNDFQVKDNNFQDLVHFELS